MIDNLDPAELYIQYDNKTILVYYYKSKEKVGFVLISFNKIISLKINSYFLLEILKVTFLNLWFNKKFTSSWFLKSNKDLRKIYGF